MIHPLNCSTSVRSQWGLDIHCLLTSFLIHSTSVWTNHHTRNLSIPYRIALLVSLISSVNLNVFLSCNTYLLIHLIINYYNFFKLLIFIMTISNVIVFYFCFSYKWKVIKRCEIPGNHIVRRCETFIGYNEHCTGSHHSSLVFVRLLFTARKIQNH